MAPGPFSSCCAACGWFEQATRQTQEEKQFVRYRKQTAPTQAKVSGRSIPSRGLYLLADKKATRFFLGVGEKVDVASEVLCGRRSEFFRRMRATLGLACAQVATLSATPAPVGHTAVIKCHSLGLGLCLSLQWVPTSLLYFFELSACACRPGVDVTSPATTPTADASAHTTTIRGTLVFETHFGSDIDLGPSPEFANHGLLLNTWVSTGS